MQNQLKMLKNINILFFLFLLFSCSENQPAINQVFWQINKVNDVENNFFYDRLSVFIEAYDDDGIEDLKTLYIINDEEEFFWKIEDKEWIYKEVNKENWFGTNDIVMNNFSHFPAGRYRVLIIDAAGEREESAFVLTSYDYETQKNKFPAIVIENKKIISLENTEALWFYTNDMKFVSETTITSKSNLNFTIKDNTNIIFAYSYDKINGYGLLSGPYKINN
jgi:hypothetical protein